MLFVVFAWLVFLGGICFGFRGVFLGDAEMQDRVLTNAVNVVTTSDLIAFLLLPL